VDCKVQLGVEFTQVDIDYEVEKLTTEWQSILLLDGNARLSSTEPKEATVIWNNGYSLLLRTPGKSVVKLHLLAPGTQALTRNGGLHLKLPAAAVKKLLVSGVPQDSSVRANGVTMPEIKNGETSTALNGTEGEAVVEVTTHEVAAPEPPELPSHWQIQTQILTAYEEGWLHLKNRVFARADGGSAVNAQILLPGNATAIKLTGEDLTEWSPATSDDGHRKINVRWKTRGMLDRQLNLEYSIPQSPLAEQWKIEGPESADGLESKAFHVVLPGDGLELKGEGLKSAIESHRLPPWMREDVGTARFVSADGPAVLTLQTHWLPEIPTAEATVETANCTTRLVSDGGIRAQVTYTISHQAPMAWKLELPNDVLLLACEIDGHRANPLQRSQGVVEIDLPAPTTTKSQSNVQLVYTMRTKPIDPVSGEIGIELPRTDLFIEHIDWSISIPPTYEPTAVNGNLSIAPSPSPGPKGEEQTIHLRKDLCRGERPAVDIYYQRLGIDK